MDMEDIGNDKTGRATIIRPVVHTMKRKRTESPPQDAAATWREALGPPPPFGNTKV